MNVLFNKKFDKSFAKQPPKVKKRAIEKIELFSENPQDVQLRKHALRSPYKGSFSIDIANDCRAIFHMVKNDTALFTHIGTHNQLYN